MERRVLNLGAESLGSLPIAGAARANLIALAIN